MREEINNQEQAKPLSGSWIGLAIGLVLLVALIALGGCSNKGGSNATPSPGAVVKNSGGMEFAYVPAGNFQMGSTNGEEYELPVHQVTFARGFYMGRYEVTQAQWQKVMGNNPSTFSTCGENCPVEQVSADDAQEFIKKLNATNDGYTYRLPSEAEWEYACRAGTTGDYAGDLNAMGWYTTNADFKTHPVGQKQANAWGLFDMHGNVAEWVMDYQHNNYNGAPTDGSAWGKDVSEDRMERGGSWTFDAKRVRSARHPGSPRLSLERRRVSVGGGCAVVVLRGAATRARSPWRLGEILKSGYENLQVGRGFYPRCNGSKVPQGSAAGIESPFTCKCLLVESSPQC
jgi:formylglycine-generating enzyme required for sulfatase activity